MSNDSWSAQDAYLLGIKVEFSGAERGEQPPATKTDKELKSEPHKSEWSERDLIV